MIYVQADMDNYVDNGSLEEYVGSPLSHDDVITSGGVGLNNHGKSCEGMTIVFLWYVLLLLFLQQFETFSFPAKSKVALLH